MSTTIRFLGLAAVVATLAACEGTDFERAALGAAGGAAAANLLGTNEVGGALIGGVIGATCDDTTTLCS